MAIRKQPENRLSQTNKQQTDQIKSIHSKSQSTEGERTWDMNGAILVAITFALRQLYANKLWLVEFTGLAVFLLLLQHIWKKKNLASQDLAVTHTFSHISHTIRTVCNHLTMDNWWGKYCGGNPMGEYSSACVQFDNIVGSVSWHAIKNVKYKYKIHAVIPNNDIFVVTLFFFALSK